MGSDHHLVTAHIKLKLKRTDRSTKIAPQRKFDIQKLRDTQVKTAFTISLKNRFTAIQDMPDDAGNEVETLWKRISTIYTESSKERIGYRQRQSTKS